MNNKNIALTTVSFVLVCFFVHNACAQQVSSVGNRSELNIILNQRMDESGRAKLNEIFELSKSNVPAYFMSKNNEYHVVVYKAFNNSWNPDQPCREGSITEVINGKSHTTRIVGCRSDGGLWSLEETGPGQVESVLEKTSQPDRKTAVPATEEEDELIFE